MTAADIHREGECDERVRRAAARPAVLRLVETDEPGTAFSLTDTHCTTWDAPSQFASSSGSSIVLGWSFPVNDGGMFYAMVRESKRVLTGFRRSPRTTGCLLHFSIRGSASTRPRTQRPYAVSLVTIFRGRPADPQHPHAVRVLPSRTRCLGVAHRARDGGDRLRAPPTLLCVDGHGRWDDAGTGFSARNPIELRLTQDVYDARARSRCTCRRSLRLTMLSHIEMAWLVLVIGGVFFIAHGRDRIPGSFAHLLFLGWS